MTPVPLWRLQLLRAFYLLLAVGTAINFGPMLGSHSVEWAQRKGEVAAMLSALAVLCLLGLRHPLQMLPILLFELAWKVIWLLVFAWPLWRAGALTPGVEESAWACLSGVVLTPLVLPWRHLWQHYIRQSAERWR